MGLVRIMHARSADRLCAVARACACPAALAAGLSVGLAGCGGSSKSGGLADKSPGAIVAAASSAIGGVRSVRVSGSVAASGSHVIDLDLHLVAGRGAIGSMSENGLSFKLVTVGGEAYVNGSPGFWKQFAGPAAAPKLEGHWLKAPSGSGAFASFQALTDAHGLLTQLLSGHGTLTKGGPATIRGTKAIAVRDASRGGTLFVATSGAAYPLRLTSGGSTGGHLDFSDFDAPVTLSAPRGAIPLGSVGG